MNWLKINWWLIIAIFAVAGWSVRMEFRVKDINDKLDTKDYYHIREVDSLKQIIKDRDFETLKSKNGLYTKEDLKETNKPKGE